jgi:DNA-binding response OmpR family regulator
MNAISVGPVKLEPVTRRLFINDNSINLRNKEFCLLEYFLRNSDIVLDRPRILEDVWDRNICWPTNTVDVHVSTLRKKLIKFNCPDFIRTVHCVGYILDSSFLNY